MKEIAKYYYGALYSGLEINSCSYPEWKKWYENSHSITENEEMWDDKLQLVHGIKQAFPAYTPLSKIMEEEYK